jgi:hypothetical protein
VFPSGGRLVIAGMAFSDVHQAIPGRRIAYATQNAHIFSGTLAHNLYYGLKHQPVKPATYDEAAAHAHEARLREALAAGNSPHDLNADWIDYESAGVASADELAEAALAVLRLVEMEDEVMRFGLASTSDPKADPDFAAMALEARRRMKERVQAESLASYVELFDRDAYQSNISVAENLVFGTPRHPSLQPVNLPSNPEVVALLRDVGLLDDFYAAGATVARLMVELFADVARRQPDVRPVQFHQRRRSAGLPHARGQDRRPQHRGARRGREGAAARPHVPHRRRAAPDRRDRRGAPAQDRRGARRVSEAIRGSRRLRRLLRSRSLQLDAVDPGQHPVRTRRVRAGERAGEAVGSRARSRSGRSG